MKPKKATKMYIVQVHQSWGWVRSYNIGVKESYTDKEKAKDVAAFQQSKSQSELKYRVKEIE